MPRFLAPLAMSMLLLACSSTSSEDQTARSGVRGIVLAGPQCPVVEQGSPCPDRPWAGTVRVTTPDGALVAEAETDLDGGFAFDLDPGSYVVVAVAGAGPPAGSSKRIAVEDGVVTELRLVVDTGIR
jgi:hypothetical protein